MATSVLDAEIVNRFDFTKIKDTKVRAKVQEATKRIRGNLRHERDLRLDTGKALQEVKAIRGFGYFDRWIADEFHFTKRTADNYMALAREFGDTYELVSYLPCQDLYRLAEGKELKPVRLKVIAAAQEGKPLPKGEVQRLIADRKKHKGKPAEADDAKAIARMEAARSAVALLHEKLEEDFSQFARWFRDAGDAFATALNEVVAGHAG